MHKMVPLSDLCEVFIGKTPSRSNSNYWGSGFNWLSIADMSKSSKLISESKEQITAAAVSETGIKLVPKNTVIFSFKLSIGKVAITEIDLFTNEAIAALHIKDSNILITEYLAYAIEIVLQTIQTDRAVMGATLNKYKINQIKIPLPSIEEQKRIAEILDRAEALKQKREQALAMADEYLRATFLNLFGDPITNPKGWPSVKLSSVFHVVRGSSPRPKGDPAFYGSGVPRLMVADITRDGKYVFAKIDSLTPLGASKSRPMNKGEFVIAVSGNPGLPAILQEDCCIHDGFAGLHKLHDVDVSLKDDFFYTFLLLMKDKNASGAAGAIFKNLTTDQLREMDILIPPKSEQERFEQTVKSLDALKAKMQTSETEIEHLAKSLSQRAFRGELTSSVKEL